MREHPVVARLLETGTWSPPGREVLACCDCGGGLGEGDEYYTAAGFVFCRRCMEDRRKEVIV